MPTPPISRAFVISDALGQQAGAYLATAQLCRELTGLGLRVTCFAQHESWAGSDGRQELAVVRPWLQRGCRWDWPGRCLAGQARRHIGREPSAVVFVCGLTPLARYLLQSAVAGRLLVWEFTNANPGNKFVDVAASRLLGRARAVLSPSTAIDQGIRQTYHYTGPLIRLPFWVEEDERDGPPAPARFIADFIFLGRRDEEKGLKELVCATAEVARQFPAVQVLIAGPGAAEPYAALARQLGVARNISFQFFATRPATLDALARSRCLVLPSYHEGYPLVLLEAAQRGVPFIATTVGSIPELYGATPAALLVPPRNAHELAAAMSRMLGDPVETHAARRQAAQALFAALSSRAVVRAALQHVLKAAAQPL